MGEHHCMTIGVPESFGWLRRPSVIASVSRMYCYEGPDGNEVFFDPNDGAVLIHCCDECSKIAINIVEAKP